MEQEDSSSPPHVLHLMRQRRLEFIPIEDRTLGTLGRIAKEFGYLHPAFLFYFWQCCWKHLFWIPPPTTPARRDLREFV